ncbi:MAG: hypothetical protein WAL58_15625, partial [Terriglobales bacterium]
FEAIWTPPEIPLTLTIVNLLCYASVNLPAWVSIVREENGDAGRDSWCPARVIAITMKGD